MGEDVSVGWYEWMIENYLAGFSSEDLIKKVHDVKPRNITAIILAIKSMGIPSLV